MWVLDFRSGDQIRARNLISILSLPAILVDADGRFVFFNEGAGEIIGARFEEVGVLEPEDWNARYGPLDADGTPVSREHLPLTTAVLGGEADVPTLAGKPLRLKIPPATQNGQVFRLKGQGMPTVNKPDERGDLYATADVQLPRELTPQQRRLFEELQKTEGAVKQLQFRALQTLRARAGEVNG